MSKILKGDAIRVGEERYEVVAIDLDRNRVYGINNFYTKAVVMDAPKHKD